MDNKTYSLGRAIWAMTGSSVPDEAAAANSRLDAFLAKNSCELRDLGGLPYPSARPLPPGTRWHATRPATPRQSESWDDFVATYRQNFGSAATPPVEVDTQFGKLRLVNDFTNLLFGQTLPPALTHSRFRERVQSGVWNIHSFGSEIFGCVGRDHPAALPFVGLYGAKWERLLAASQTRIPSPDPVAALAGMLGTVQSKIKLRSEPLSMALTGDEEEGQWIGLDPDDVNALLWVEPAASDQMLTRMRDAVRQFQYQKPIEVPQ